MIFTKLKPDERPAEPLSLRERVGRPFVYRADCSFFSSIKRLSVVGSVIFASQLPSKMFLLFLLGVLMGGCGVMGHSYHLGSCPNIEPMHGFEMSRVSRLLLFLRR